MDFYARQEAARRTTRWLLVAFLVSVALVVIAVDVVVAFVVASAGSGTSPVNAVVGSSVVVLGIICGASLFKTLSLRAGGGSVARSLGGTRIERATSLDSPPHAFGGTGHGAHCLGDLPIFRIKRVRHDESARQIAIG